MMDENLMDEFARAGIAALEVAVKDFQVEGKRLHACLILIPEGELAGQVLTTFGGDVACLEVCGELIHQAICQMESMRPLFKPLN